MVPEDPEHFSVMLSMTTPLAGVILTPDNATVVINDDDGKCSDSWKNIVKTWYHVIILNAVILGFERESYSISEGNGSVEVCIQVKTGVLQSLLHLSLITVDGIARGKQG